MKKHNFVYLTTNLITGKCYVGSHETNNLLDGYIGSGSYFKNSVKKYGKDNFKREILESCKEIKEARLLEELYINKHKTLYPNGYNMSSTGGFGEYGGKHSEESKKKMSDSAKGKKRVFSEEHKKKLSNAAKKWHDEVGFSEETKEKMSKSRKGVKMPPESIDNYKKGNSGKNKGRKRGAPWNKGLKLKNNEQFKL